MHKGEIEQLIEVSINLHLLDEQLNTRAELFKSASSVFLRFFFFLQPGANDTNKLNTTTNKMSKGLVLISGVNGYIAAVTAKHLLENGFSVRGTVRKVASAKPLLEGPLKEYASTGSFNVVEVPDITVDGAFDEAVKGACCRLTAQYLFNSLQM